MPCTSLLVAGDATETAIASSMSMHTQNQWWLFYEANEAIASPPPLSGRTPVLQAAESTLRIVFMDSFFGDKWMTFKVVHCRRRNPSKTPHGVQLVRA